MRDSTRKSFETALQHRLQTLVVTTLVAILISGCCLPLASSDDTKKHLIIGVGLVSVNDGAPDAAVATSVKSLGVSVTNQPGLKGSVGYASSKVVTIAKGASVTIEVSYGLTDDFLIKVIDYQETVP